MERRERGEARKRQRERGELQIIAALVCVRPGGRVMSGYSRGGRGRTAVPLEVNCGAEGRGAEEQRGERS